MRTKFALAFVIAILAVFTLTTVMADTWSEYEIAIEEMTVYVNGEEVWHGECIYDPLSVPPEWDCETEQKGIPALEREEEAEIRVTFKVVDELGDTSELEALEKTRVRVWLGGHYENVEARTSSFDAFEGRTYTKNLDLFIPKDIDAWDDYTLHVDIEQKRNLGGVDEADIDMNLQRITHNLEILSVEIFDNENFYRGLCEECTVTFNAGTTIYIDVVVKNRGNYEIEDIYVNVNIPELCVERTVYLGDLDPKDTGDDDNEDAKRVTIPMKIPEDTKEGVYALEVKAYDSRAEDETFTRIRIEGTKEVKPEPKPEQKEVFHVVPQISTATIERGKGEVFTILMTNYGKFPRNVVVKLIGTDAWSNTEINPAAFTLMPGDSETVNIYVAVADNAVEGEHMFTALVAHDSQTEQVKLTANVVAAGPAYRGDWKTALFVIGLVLAVVIIVLLIVLIAQSRTVEGTTETEESYY